MIDILHRSAEIEVRRVAAGDGRLQVITFDPYHDVKGFDREGFGEAYFAREGITAIHVLTRDNDWYQYREMPVVLETIRAGAAGAERRLAYGSSMGGYAALRFAAAVGVDAALALSPQYSVDRRRSSFDRRWMQDRRRIRFDRHIDGRIAPGVRSIVAYDPTLEADRRHVEAIAAEIATERVPLRHAGHPVGAFLAETHLLRPLVADALAGSFDGDAFTRLAHERRGQSPTWRAGLAAALPPHRRALALSLAERAATLAPDNPAILDRWALQLADAGAFWQAIVIHQRAIAQHPIANYRWGLGQTLLAAGEVDAALEVAETLIREAPEVAGYRRWSAEVRLRLGDLAGARRDMAAASRLAPRNWGYRRAALRLGGQLLGRRLFLGR